MKKIFTSVLIVGVMFSTQVQTATLNITKDDSLSPTSISGQATISYDLKDFNKLEINHAFVVNIEQGDHYEVKAKGKKEDLKYVSVMIEGNTLVAEIKNSNTKFNRKLSPVKLDIVMPDLEELTLSGANKIKIDNFKTDNITIDLSGANSVWLNMDVDVIDIELFGANNIELNGSANLMKMDVSGANKIMAYAFKTTETDIELSGVSIAYIHVTQKLAADLSGVSKLYYKGNPIIKSEVSGISVMRHQ